MTSAPLSRWESKAAEKKKHLSLTTGVEHALNTHAYSTLCKPLTLPLFKYLM